MGAPTEEAKARRLGLLVFGASFLILFAIVAITEGLGDPSIPSGDVVLVENVPGDAGKISQEDFDHALVLATAQAGEDKPPKPGDPKYEDIRDAAVTSLLEAAWFEGQAAEMGIEVSDAKVARELKKVKKETFQSQAEFQKFLMESKFTDEDVDERLKLQLLSTEIQEQLNEEQREPSQGEIESYYEAVKATIFATPASRDIRLIRNEDRAKVVRALSQLEESHTPKDWSEVAEEFSEDTATKGRGGLQEGVTDRYLEETIGASALNAAEGELMGPLKTPTGYVAFEVESINPESIEDLESVESTIESQLSEQIGQEDFDAFVADFEVKWRSRTFCAEGFVVEQCANSTLSGHPDTAPSACYEADPKGGRPEACLAPVFQLVPAVPGTVTPIEPKGKQLAQRPHPAGEGTTTGTEGTAGLSEGAPPTGE
jgi:parvulin-like peptidyl-prolyl isomerase